VFEDIEQGKVVSITPRWDVPLEEDDNSLLFDFF